MRRITRADRVGTLLLIALLVRRLRCPVEPAAKLTRGRRALVGHRRSSQPGSARHGASPLPLPTSAAPPSSRRCRRHAPTRPFRRRPSPTIAGSDAGSITAITAAVDALGALRSYRMSVDVVGLDLAGLQPASSDLGVRGTVTHTSGLAMDALVGVRMREPNGSAAISSGARYVMGDGYVWATDNLSEVLEPSSDASIVSLVVLLSPEGLATRAIEPFAGGYRRIGIETHRRDQDRPLPGGPGRCCRLCRRLPLSGTITADLWIAATGGELVGARVAGT